MCFFYLISGTEPLTKGCPGFWFPGPAQRGGWHAGKGVHAAARHSPPRCSVPADPRCPAAQAGQYWHLWVRWLRPQHHTFADRLLWEQHWKNVKLTLGAFLLFHFKSKWFRVKTFPGYSPLQQPSEDIPEAASEAPLIGLDDCNRLRALTLAFRLSFSPRHLLLPWWVHLLRSLTVWWVQRSPPSSGNLTHRGPLAFWKASSLLSVIRTFSRFCSWNEQPRLSGSS